MIKTNTRIIGNYLDNILIYFPFWFPFIYLGLIINIPQVSTFIFVAVLFMFAESHFATTWLFLFDRSNYKWAKDNLYELLIQPLFLIFLFIIFWNINTSIVLILHYIASGWHVTRQSIGVSKLSKNKSKAKFLLIYTFSFLCLCIGLLNPGIFALNLSRSIFNTILLTFFVSYLVGIYLAERVKINLLDKNNLSILTGISIYLPLLFFEDVAVALAIGVGMHWVQYLALTLTTNGRKLFFSKSKNNLFTNKKFILISSFILIYSLIMTSLTVVGVQEVSNQSSNSSYLYLIPILFQFYHFYIDRYLWRFSDPHIQKNVVPYIFRN
tara:strand:- start:1877 stop:2851 length:975 start_codon:yes stop_codon:yes gene_type:complete